MAAEVVTPITQALNEGAITRRELKALMVRSNGPAFLHLVGWLTILFATGTGIYFAMGTYWFIPAMFVHGIVVVHLFSLQHECTHFSVFATRWLNNYVGQICGFLTLVPHQYFRYEHCDHHTYTQLKGRDPELIELPISAKTYLSYVSGIPYWTQLVRILCLHVIGKLTEEEKVFIPKEAYAVIILEARFYAAGYAAICIASVAAGWGGALWYWVVPSLIAQPVMRAIRMTEHVGRPNISDFKENTRTNIVSHPLQFLCWNMNYHAEHHYASSVPFHALPKLHVKLDGYIHVEPKGYLGAHVEIIRQIMGFAPRSDVEQKTFTEQGRD